MKTYTAINIGPIIGTLSLARKPRELWAASYLCSLLMQCIIESLPKNIKIISPALLNQDNDKTVGLYPDRIFIEEEIDDKIINENAIKAFLEKTGIHNRVVVKNYFNIMIVTKECDPNNAIKELNQILDTCELYNRAPHENNRSAIRNYLSKEAHYLEKFMNDKFQNDSIETIASYGIETSKAKSDKYICIVQADGDNMGSVVSKLPIEEIQTLSKQLLTFGTRACAKIREFGGVPIYAGGDDLLFFAPVESIQGTIFDLVNELDNLYKIISDFVEKKNLTDMERKTIRTSMSYGISISYIKFPLYEALITARETLFDTAKKVTDKNAIAWTLQKHSGSCFNGSLSKTNEELYAAFKNVIKQTEDERLVSAVAHKIRANEGLLALWLGKTENEINTRLESFFDKIIDIEGKNKNTLDYLQAVRKLLECLYRSCLEGNIATDEDRFTKMKELATITYSTLRTAKFIKGKEENNE